MNITESRKRLLLIALIVLLSASIFSQFTGTPEEEAVIDQIPPKSSSPQVKTGDVLESRLLSADMPRFIKEERNIFQFQGTQNVAVEPTTMNWLKTQPPPQVKPVVPNVHYLGFYLEKQNPSVKLAAISNSGRIYVGKVGDTLAGKYQVQQIEKMFLVLRLVDDQKIIRLPLGKQNGVFVDTKGDDEEDEDDSEEE